MRSFTTLETAEDLLDEVVPSFFDIELCVCLKRELGRRERRQKRKLSPTFKR